MKRSGLAALALLTLATTLVTALVTTACNGGAKTESPASTGAPVAAAAPAADLNKVSDDDRDYVQDALAAGDAEIALGKIASTKGVNAEVKRFAAMMIADHTKAGDALKMVAATHNIQSDASRKPKDADKVNDLTDKLTRDTRPAFDRDYIDAMVQGHQDVVDMLQQRVDTNASASDTLTNAPARDTNVVPEKADNHVTMAVNQWAAETLPTARRHLDEAKGIQDRLKKK
jgi:putative membrane protein